jgi:integrase
MEARFFRAAHREDLERRRRAVRGQVRRARVPLSDHLAVVLKQQKLSNGSSPWVFPCSTNRFEGVKGERMAEFPDNTWRRVLKAAGLSGGPHKARHTFASHYLAAKPDVFRLGRILGHSHSRVTELYSHLLPEHLVEEVKLRDLLRRLRSNVLADLLGSP